MAQQNADTQLSVLSALTAESAGSGLTAESAGKNLAGKRTQNQAEDVTQRRCVKVVFAGHRNHCVTVAKSRQFTLAAMKTGAYISAALTHVRHRQFRSTRVDAKPPTRDICHMRLSRWILRIAPTTLFAAATLSAQGTTTGAITGTVTNQQGAGLSAAQVRVTNTTTGYTASATTRDNGYHLVHGLEVDG